MGCSRDWKWGRVLTVPCLKSRHRSSRSRDEAFQRFDGRPCIAARGNKRQCTEISKDGKCGTNRTVSGEIAMNQLTSGGIRGSFKTLLTLLLMVLISRFADASV